MPYLIPKKIRDSIDDYEEAILCVCDINILDKSYLATRMEKKDAKRRLVVEISKLIKK